ncbi:MAG: CBS domain-containing protein [Deltaproteobacteria bacterium]|nr:MAG: CBS domain-containing protein [Deltaproteobacteria bacterium]
MASENPIVSDLVIPLDRFPHMYEHQTLHDAVEVINSFTCGGDDRLGYAELLILNERNQLSGRVSLQDILLSLDPRLKELARVKSFEGKVSEFPNLVILWEDSFFVECTKWSHIHIRDLMSPIKHIVKGSDPVLKALAIMINIQHAVLPVVDNKRVIGVIRMKEIFKSITAKCRI